ncbi:hypothetical protein CC78DRAFT_530992 [Lojkania enalia]|uniref:Metallo-beta-lactamase domain-containing protein n=1 Tax=Lojkania enalia TaxID=147567 RepID=A0A9P4N7S1_9PLEO|nr:hypothetical protein CC78DRAFT_530992 [Didymosphaeria enalia]
MPATYDPVAPPDLTLPPSTNTVSVSIIDTTSSITGLPTSRFFVPEVSGAKYFVDVRAFSFLIQHPRLNRHLLFDLGIRKDIENVPFINNLKSSSAEVKVEKGVREVLEEGGFDATRLEAVIWSHWHFDHTGNPSTFEPHTAVIVGPGFKNKVAPGYPANPDAHFLESDYTGRELREIDFSPGAGVTSIGQFRALDYFGDGSFYLLDTPGHAVGHLCGLARVTSNPDSFIFMGGDACHHPGEFRPSKYLPFPPNISPNPFTSFTAPTAPCPGSLFEGLLRDGDPTRSFYDLSPSGVHYNVEEAEKTIAKIQGADCRDNILVAVAHDSTLPSVVDFFPKTANEFVEKGWVKKLRWLFLRDFAKAVGYDGEVEGISADWAKWNGTG